MALKRIRTRTRIKSIKGTIKLDKLPTLRQLKKQLGSEDIGEREFRVGPDIEQDGNLKVSDKEKQDLAAADWVYVPSSNVKAVRLVTINDTPRLQVLYGSNSVYEWISNAVQHYNGILASGSKGTYSWENLYGSHSRKIR